MKKVLTLILAFSMIFALSACGKDRADKMSLAVCLASEPLTIDPALNCAADGASMLFQV